MDHVIDALKAEQTQLRTRLAKIDAAIEEYERWAKSVVDLVGDDNALPTVKSSVDPVLKATPMTDFEVEVRALLGRVPGPLKRNEVYEELSKIGVVVGGKEPLNTVASRLSRMQGVINLKGFGYWPEERPYPPAGHPRQFNSSQGLFNEPDVGPDERASATMDAGTSAGEE